jgi:hypothetical protein
VSYSTEALLTDVNGKFIPQYYDVATGEFLPLTEATGFAVNVVDSALPDGAATNAKLDSVISELDAIKTKLNGEIDTVLKGSIATLIKSFVGVTNLLTQSFFRYGENSASGSSNLIALDISQYKSKMIRIRNNYNASISVDIRFHFDPVLNSSTLTTFISSFAIPAGTSALFTPISNVELYKIPARAISITMNGAQTSGSADIYFWGGA